jgi:hypothetical protein
MLPDGVRRIRGIGTMIISGVLAIFLWQSAQGLYAPSSGVVIFMFLSLLVFIFIGGLGLFAGSMTGQLPTRSKAICLAGSLVVIIPAALMGWVVYGYEVTTIAAEKPEIAALAGFQNQTLTGSFGGYSIVLPVVPSLHIVHACHKAPENVIPISGEVPS